MLSLIDEAQSSGARFEPACRTAGIDPRTVQRWRAKEDGGSDQRQGPLSAPSNKLSKTERETIIRIATSPKYRDKSPRQIVPLLADENIYLASESTVYRILRAERMMSHRGRSKEPTSRRPRERVATGPRQVWSWDITYLKSPIAGRYYYLYLIVDVWSRKVVGYAVHETESTELASRLLINTIKQENAFGVQLVLHSDNGAPMKGSTMKATMERLGVIASYSRPHVSNDNAYSESLFRTLKYRPGYPSKPFSSQTKAEDWVTGFVSWYNTEHLHSTIGFITPQCRHDGQGEQVLAKRRAVYERARHAHPERWAGRSTRQWTQPVTVRLNPHKLDPSSPQNPMV